MEATSPFDHHHPSLLDQCLSFSNPVAISFGYEFYQPNELVLPTSSIEASANWNKSFISNDSQKLESTDIMAKPTCKRRRKQKKNNNDEENKKKMIDSKEEGQIGYIHVRARRGQATDSHSLAERVRREKISEKMKALQSIVPGCDKITGKAHMLDEVINYVQSLQNEIQILSLKLASVSTMYDYGAEYDQGCMLKPHDQQQLHLIQENQMPCMIWQNNDEALWDLEENRQELEDLFAIINYNSCS